MWNDIIDMKIVLINDCAINCMVCNDPISTLWQFTTMYGPTISSLRKGVSEFIWEFIHRSMANNWLF